eukprot:Hpha_TRINITY_DN17563_c0_g1::TRINITY_DN17563_c0_g1_i1::g.92544::m.92544
MPQHWNVHTEATSQSPPDQLPWPVTTAAPLSRSVEGLQRMLDRKFKDDPEMGAGFTQEEFMQTFCMVPAEKEEEHLLDMKAAGPPVPWSFTAEEVDPPPHYILRRQTEEDRAILGTQVQPDGAPAGPPAGEPPPPATTTVDTDTRDIPRHNAVMVTGTLPMQQLTIGQLTWRALAQKPSPGLRTRPVQTATMCPTCGIVFAMNVPEDLVKRHQLTNPEMEQKLSNALEAQRVVLEAEKQALGQELHDVRSALTAINAALARSREDDETLLQLQQQQKAWVKWLEQEIRQAKGEIGQVAVDFERCLQSNLQLEALVEQAISRRVETKYIGTMPQRRGAAVGPPAPPPPLSSPQPAAIEGHPRGGGGRGGAAAKREHVRGLVRAFYQRHNPGKLMLVDTLVDEYQGRERELLGLMAQKYGDQTILAYDAALDGDAGHASPPSSHWSVGSAAPAQAHRGGGGAQAPAPFLQGDGGPGDQRIQSILTDILSGGVARQADPPPPLPDVNGVGSDGLGNRERELVRRLQQHGAADAPSPVPASGAPLRRFGSASQPLAWGSPSPGVGGAGGYYGDLKDSTLPSSSESRVTFDLRPQHRGAGVASPTLRDELLRVAPNTLARRSHRLVPDR